MKEAGWSGNPRREGRSVGFGRGGLKPVARLLEESAEPVIKVRSKSEKGNYGKIVNSIPVEGGELEIEVERLEFTDTETGEVKYQAWISIGNSSDPTIIDLPPDRCQHCYSTLVCRLRNGQYDTRVVDGIVRIFPRGLDF